MSELNEISPVNTIYEQQQPTWAEVLSAVKDMDEKNRAFLSEPLFTEGPYPRR